MNELKEWFKEDCPNAPEFLFELYEKGYNRAQIEFLEQQLTDLKNKAGQWYVQHWLDEVYNNIRGDFYAGNY